MAATTMVLLDSFGRVSYTDQKKNGDLLQSGFVPDIRSRTRPEIIEFDVMEIWKLKSVLSPDEREQFIGNYGKLLTLIDVKIDWGCIRAAIKFWDPYYRCFTFNGEIDLVPTLEEYSMLLAFNRPISLIYQNVRFDPIEVKTRIDSLLGIPTQVKDGRHVWCWSDIVTEFHDSDGRRRLRILAFAMVGFVLFPKIKDCIDFEAANVFYEMEVNGINPTTAILAETLRSLDLCKRTGKGKFACCSQLLTAWLVSHFKQIPEQSLFSRRFLGSTPLGMIIDAIGEELVVDKWKLEDKDAWMDRFLDLSENDINRHSKWLRGVNPIVCCGNSMWVPLVGARGCVSYCPALVLSQFCIMQIVPATYGMSRSSLPHSPNNPILYQYVNDWRTPYCLEGHVVYRQPSNEYLYWRKSRVNGYVLPSPKNKKPMEEEGESHVSGEANYIAYAEAVEQWCLMKTERDEAVRERDNLFADKMYLEQRVRGLEQQREEDTRVNLRNQESAHEVCVRRITMEIRKREASSALIKEKDAMIGVLTTRIRKMTGKGQDRRVWQVKTLSSGAAIGKQKEEMAMVEIAED